MFIKEYKISSLLRYSNIIFLLFGIFGFIVSLGFFYDISGQGYFSFYSIGWYILFSYISYRNFSSPLLLIFHVVIFLFYFIPDIYFKLTNQVPNFGQGFKENVGLISEILLNKEILDLNFLIFYLLSLMAIILSTKPRKEKSVSIIKLKNTGFFTLVLGIITLYFAITFLLEYFSFFAAQASAIRYDLFTYIFFDHAFFIFLILSGFYLTNKQNDFKLSIFFLVLIIFLLSGSKASILNFLIFTLVLPVAYHFSQNATISYLNLRLVFMLSIISPILFIIVAGFRDQVSSGASNIFDVNEFKMLNDAINTIL